MNYIVTIIFAWVVCAFVASGVAPRGRQAEFFVLSLLILGPPGVGFAAVAMPRVTVLGGRRGIACPRCAAVQYVGTGVDEFYCWRCDQHVAVGPGPLGRPAVEAASMPKVAPKATPVGKTASVRCSRCQHAHQVPVGASTFQCEECNTTLKRAAKS